MYKSLPRWLQVCVLLSASSFLLGMSAVTGSGLGAARAQVTQYYQTIYNAVLAAFPQEPGTRYVGSYVYDDAVNHQTVVVNSAYDGGLTPGTCPAGSSPANIYWNPSTGSDANSGLSSGAPVLTWRQVKTILCGAPYITGVQVPIYGTTTVTMQAGQVSGDLSDMVDFPFYSATNQVTFTLLGVPAVAHSGTFTGISALNRSTPKMWQVTDTALPAANSWAAYEGDLLVDTTQNCVTTIDYDANYDGVAKTANLKPWWQNGVATYNSGPGVQYCTNNNAASGTWLIASGDSYTISVPPVLYMDAIRAQTNLSANSYTGVQLVIDSVNISRPRSNNGDIEVMSGLSGVILVRDTISAAIHFIASAQVLAQASTFTACPIIYGGSQLYMFGSYFSVTDPCDGVGYPLVYGVLQMLNDSGLTCDPNVTCAGAIRVKPGAWLNIGSSMAVWTTGQPFQVEGGHVDIQFGTVMYGGTGTREPYYVFQVGPGGTVYAAGNTAAATFNVSSSQVPFSLSQQVTACGSNAGVCTNVSTTVANLAYYGAFYIPGENNAVTVLP